MSRLLEILPRKRRRIDAFSALVKNLKAEKGELQIKRTRRHRELFPLKEMAKEIQSRMPSRMPQGRKPLFPPEGEIALMFFKNYSGLSDYSLVEMLNGSQHMQIFCGLLIDPCNLIGDGKIVSISSIGLPQPMCIKDQQKLLYSKWDDRINDKDMFMTDATCY